MNELQLTFVPDGTKEQAQAVSLHYEIMSAAQSAVSSLLMSRTSRTRWAGRRSS